MNVTTVLIVATALLAYGLFSNKIQGTSLTGPMLFAALGLLIGPTVFDLTQMQITNAGLHVLAEITLVLVLFSDAASIDLKQLRRDHDLPLRMLVIGMPLTIILGTLAAFWLFPGFGVWEAALLAAILAPTDAALGMSVVADPVVPVRIRQTLNVESGLNDGIALPFVLVFAALASATADVPNQSYWVRFALLQIALGPVAGIFVGYIGARLVSKCYARQWMNESSEGAIALALAFGAYAAGELIHGNGFIAAFVAGLTFGNTLQRKCEYLYEFAESEGMIPILLTFAVFGVVLLPEVIGHISLPIVLFALLAITFVRMLPVSISLIGTGVSQRTSLFLGWFGPRGLASILFVLLILERSEAPHQQTILITVTVTVALSILLHGATAGPAAVRYGAAAEKMGACAENRPVSSDPFS